MEAVETKILTMADAVKVYQERQAEKAADDAQYAAELASELTKLLTLGGLVPLRVERNVATFEYEGREVKFRIWRESGSHWMRRVDNCPKCGAEIRSFDKNAHDLANFGELLVDPSWDFHYCNSDASPETAEQRLVSALREVLGLDNA